MEFYNTYNIFPEQIDERVKLELTRLTGSDTWDTAKIILTEHPEMFQTAVTSIIYGG